MRIGAQLLENNRCEFIVWGPYLKDMTLEIVYPAKQSLPMQRDNQGYWNITRQDITAGTRYFYRLDGKQQRPDPASFYQPEGVHGPSEVIDHNAYQWRDRDYRGILLDKMVIYELHVGTFTKQATFEAIIPRLDDLISLGINTVEYMPVAQFPGERNWGYDGTYPFSVQNSYGGPEGLKKIVDACHNKGVSVILDVVYNHLGPEGNYLREFGPYFTDKYKTPWGSAVNFDDRDSFGVRNYFVQNALYWFREFHIDALRLDAIHGIYDFSPRHILQQLVERTKDFSQKQGRLLYIIAESDLNDARVIRSRQYEGYGVDAQWCDDFHHCLHTLLTQENSGYYADFGKLTHLSKSLQEGYVYSGQYSRFRKGRHGNSSNDIPADKFIVFSQNHDQVGNRMLGERLSSLVDFEGLKLAAGLVLNSPYIPLIFMGEEYAEDNPFLYFVSHSDTHLIQAVREGRRREFQSFKWNKEPPDPQDSETFQKSKLAWDKRISGKGKALLDFYRKLISLRKENPVLSVLDNKNLQIKTNERKKIIFLRRSRNEDEVFILMSFNKKEIPFFVTLPGGRWRKTIDSSDTQWLGPGSSLPEFLEKKKRVTLRPLSFIIFAKET